MKTFKHYNLILIFLITFLGKNCFEDSKDINAQPVNSEDSIDMESPFVQVYDGNFMLNGTVFRFAGTNAYYLPNYEKIGSQVVEGTLNAIQAADIKVVRMWAFYDGYDCGYSANDSEENVIQTLPGVYNEEALKNLDIVIAKGKQRGLLFILPFINFWDELGGICQYNTWAGAENPSVNMDFFLNNEQTQKWYRDYITMLLNRVNTFTGVAYKDEPAIMSWQIMNEGRNKGQNPEILRDWYREMAQFIKTIAPNQLVGTGEEGFDEGTPSKYSVRQYSNTYVLRADEGTSYILNTSIPEIDYGNAHWYPTEFGFGFTISRDLLKAQDAWISDHKRIANVEGKPFMLGEYGFPGWGDERVRAMYVSLWSTAEEIELDGSLLWQLTSDYAKCTEYGGNICWPGGREDTEIFKSFINHISIIQREKENVYK